VELLPYNGRLTPLAYKWEYDREDLLVTLGLWLVNLVYLLLAVAGCWMLLARSGLSKARAPASPFRGQAGISVPLQPPGVMFLIAYVVIRTFFLTHVETPEPRYVLECFPAVIALAAQFWQRRTSGPSRPLTHAL
ncbi:MAG TPA: hypothetical protein VJW51_06480, partial [Candidatus Acidoferrales bacterium]|nr:hypothetical protein [Candidatus Acidoferrales bacterium]